MKDIQILFRPNRFGGVARFFVFSQQLLIGYSGLGQLRVNDCTAGLEPPQGLELGEKLLCKYEEPRHGTKPTMSFYFLKKEVKKQQIKLLMYLAMTQFGPRIEPTPSQSQRIIIITKSYLKRRVSFVITPSMSKKASFCFGL